jgi:hypothetical protein
VVHQASGLPCSVGLSADKSTAKYASDLRNANGLTVIPTWEAAQRLRGVPVTELRGIGEGIRAYLAARGGFTCGDMARLSISDLARRFGRPHRRPSSYINRQLKQSMLCSKLLFTWTEISGGSQWAGKPAPNTTQEMGGQS